MKIFAGILLAMMLAAAPAFAGPPSAALKAKVDAAAPTPDPAGVYDSGKIKKGGSTTITLKVDPTKDTFIMAVCEGCYMFSLIASDEAGEQLKATYGDPEPMVLIEPGMAPSGKVKLQIDMTSGCEESSCVWVVGLYY